MEGSIYIHVPFCQSRCIYCDFYSTTYGGEWKSRFVTALIEEMQQRREEMPLTRVHSLYIGGGTPSQLPVEELHRLFAAVGSLFSLEADAEVTMELNPDDVTPELLAFLRQTPVNRISMGVQTFSDEILRFLSRRHTASQALRAVAACRQAGFTNISIDLIYGLPGQTFEQWRQDVEQALSLRVPHLSAYALTYEADTPLGRMLAAGQVSEADEEESWRMYSHLMERAEQAGLEHYEISNFALPGMYSRHNSGYWQGTPYLGLGPGAHSYDGRATRRANSPDLVAYVASHGLPPHVEEHLTTRERYEDDVLTRLRTSAGLPLSLLLPEDRAYCLRMAAPHLQAGRLVFRGDCLCLTKQGIFVSNDILSDLMYG